MIPSESDSLPLQATASGSGSAAPSPFRAALVPVVVSAILVAVKAAVGFTIGSLAVLASALDSLLDCGISTVNLFSIRKAEEPPDQDHPFGHGKAESIAVLFEGLFVAGSGVALAWQGVRHLLRPRPLDGYGLGILVMLAGLIAALAVNRFLLRHADRTGSRILRADSFHYASDAWTSGGVIAALALQSWTGLSWIDPAFSIVIALWILWQVRPVLRGAVDELMDRELAETERAEIERILQSHAPEILDYHRLRTRRAGPQKTVDVHVVICKERPFEEAHALAARLERAIRDQVPNSDVLVHADPCSSAPVRCPGPHRERGQPAGARGPVSIVFYESVEELPQQLRRELSLAAQERYVQAFNGAYRATGSPEAAAEAARRALLPPLEREGERWVKRGVT